MARTLFCNVNIFDGTHPEALPGEVMVEGNRIAEIGRPGERLTSIGCEIVDGGGATLIPGLINTHVHLTYINKHNRCRFDSASVRGTRPGYGTQREARSRYGVHVGDWSGLRQARLDIVIRKEINANRLPGPRTLAGSPELTVTGGLADDNQWDAKHPSISIICDTPGEFRKTVRMLIREGVDLSLLQDRNAILAIMKDGSFYKRFEGRAAAGAEFEAGRFPVRVQVDNGKRSRDGTASTNGRRMRLHLSEKNS